MVRMLEKPELKETDLIPNDEFRKRSTEFFKKYLGDITNFTKLITENKISWGTVVEINAEKYAENVAIKFEDIALTYKEFNEQVNLYAHFFISKDLKKGDVVELMMTNRPEYLIIIAAIGKIGAITSLINIDLRELSLIHCLNLTPSKIIIVGENCLNDFNNVKSDIDNLQDHTLCFLPDQGLLSTPKDFIDLYLEVKNFSIENPSTTLSVKTSDPITYIFTSGTTGFPKATIVAHSSLLIAYYIFGPMLLELTPDDTMYVSLPLFHSNSIVTGCASTFGGGSSLAIARKFSTSRFWDEIRKYNATGFNYIGEVCRYLMNQPPKPDDSENPVRMVIGAGLRPEIWMDFKKRFNIRKIGEYYSATEAVGGFFNFLDFDRTVGYCFTSYAIVRYDHEEEEPVRNEKGFMKRVKLGESGLLLFKIEGTAVFRGYTDRKATESKIFHNVFKEGDKWFNTGDLMKDIGNNHTQFVDRLGDTFRWKGHNISTTEVEEIINGFNQVLFSTVYGIKIPGTDGRAGMAAIVPNSSIEDFNVKGLADLLRENLPSYGVPLFLRFKSKLLTTATFKLKKVKLKKEGFDFEKVDDPMYVLLPDESEFIPLKRDIYDNIQKQRYTF